jgi:hypothetical protein
MPMSSEWVGQIFVSPSWSSIVVLSTSVGLMTGLISVFGFKHDVKTARDAGMCAIFGTALTGTVIKFCPSSHIEITPKLLDEMIDSRNLKISTAFYG